jgi:hypothetical protein
MVLVKEPKNIDLIIQSKPWTEEELAELSAIIIKRKEKKLKKRKARLSKTSKKTHLA